MNEKFTTSVYFYRFSISKLYKKAQLTQREARDSLGI